MANMGFITVSAHTLQMVFLYWIIDEWIIVEWIIDEWIIDN
jgi:hypothetical protein